MEWITLSYRNDKIIGYKSKCGRFKVYNKHEVTSTEKKYLDGDGDIIVIDSQGETFFIDTFESALTTIERKSKIKLLKNKLNKNGKNRH